MDYDYNSPCIGRTLIHNSCHVQVYVLHVLFRLSLQIYTFDSRLVLGPY